MPHTHPSTPRLRTLCMALTATFFAFLVHTVTLANTGQRIPLFAPFDGHPLSDKVGHFVLGGLLTLGLTVSTRFKTIRLGARHILLGPVLVAMVAITEECSQYLIPTRNFDLTDLMADAAGILTFALFARWLSKRISPHFWSDAGPDLSYSASSSDTADT